MRTLDIFFVAFGVTEGLFVCVGAYGIWQLLVHATAEVGDPLRDPFDNDRS